MPTSIPARSMPASAPLVLVAVTAAALVPAQGAAAQWHQAPEELPLGAEIHPCIQATERCDGEIQVPLDWSDPDSERITVAFAWIPRSDTTRPATGTVMANPGGPGAARPMVAWLQQVLGPVLERQNLLVVDPRGLGQSDPLLCPGLDLGDPDSVSACAEHLGPRLKHFTAAQAAADLDAVRRALALPAVSFYGNSYGTLIAQAYAARFPGSLTALFLDSVVYTGDDGYGLQPARLRIADLELICERSPACRSIDSGAGATLERLVDRLRTEPDPDIPLQALRPLTQGARSVFGRETVAAAAAYLAGDRRPLRRLAAGLGGQADQSPTGEEWAGYLAYMCADMWLPYDRGASLDERRRQLEAYYATERPLWPLDATEVAHPSLIYERCLAWPLPRESPPVPSDAAYPSVPVLAAAGDFDTATPEEVSEVIRRFPAGSVVHVPYGTHALAWSPLPHGQCVRDLLRAFLDEPRHPPDYPGSGECDAESYRAVGSFPRTVADVPPARADGLSAAPRHLVAAVFATAADAVARRNPYDAAPPGPATQDGLRGGTTRWDRDRATIQLKGVRFVDDLAVSGVIRINPDHTVSADLSATDPDGRERTLVLEWRAFVANDDTPVSGTLDGGGFRATVPLH